VAAVVLNCVLLDVVPISIVGDGTGNGAFGYSFLPQGATQPIYTTALDFLNNGKFANWLVPFVPPQDSACMSLVGHIAGTGGLRHNAASTRAALQNYAWAYSEKP
jgi:hypothetical protein